MITLILPYYNQPLMLAKQLEVIRTYPKELKVIVVDDGSKDDARSHIDLRKLRGIDFSLYRIKENIPWNREEARNLGAYKADTDWIIQLDIDHILPAKCAEKLLEYSLKAEWYRFPRKRRGKADATRQKDALPPDAVQGNIHPHQDSYLIRRDWFLASPYDERYAGCLGGGTPFLKRMEQLHGNPKLLPASIYLEVWTMDKIGDASVSLNRDKSEYVRRRELYADECPPRMLCHPWEQVI